MAQPGGRGSLGGARAGDPGTAQPGGARGMPSGPQGPGAARVEVPRSALQLFSQPQVHVPIEAAAQALGFAGERELRRFATPLLKPPPGDDADPLGTHVGALAFKRLVALCASKTAPARKLLEEMMLAPRGDGVSLPAHPEPPGGPLLRWAACAPEAVGMDKAPFERLHPYFQWRTRMRHFAGISCGIVKNGVMAYYHESGYADVESKAKMTGDTIVRLFSMTKCLVSAAFMTFVEDPSCNVDVDDPVSKYIPAFEKSQMRVLPKRGQKEPQPLEKPITLRQLITHTSGIGYGATLDEAWPPPKGSYYKIYEDLCEQTKSGALSSLAEWCDALAKVPLKGQPGHFWDYSYSLDVLGRALEVIAGKPLDEVVEERICGPLKMRDTSFVVPPEKAHRLGAWYKSSETNGKPNLAHQLTVIDKGGQESGWVGANASRILSGGGTVEVPLSMKGGMVSTFNDYLRFLLMLRNFGELDGVRVLRRETVQLMVCNHIPAACYGKKTVFVFSKPGLGYSCLGQIQNQNTKQDRGAYAGEYGWGGLAGPAWTIDPRSDFIVLSMTQTAFVLDHEEYLRYAARRAIHQHIYGSVAAPSKATSYSPECFDVVRPKPSSEQVSKTEATMDREFEEEHRITAKTRIRGAKECAILPGARLDRHPSDEESRDASQREEGRDGGQREDGREAASPLRAEAAPLAAETPAKATPGEARESAATPAAKRRRSVAGATAGGPPSAGRASLGRGSAGVRATPLRSAAPSPAASLPAASPPTVARSRPPAAAAAAAAAAPPSAALAAASPLASPTAVAAAAPPLPRAQQASVSQVAQAPSPGRLATQALSPTQGAQSELLFSRVCVQTKGEAERQEKARITAVEGNDVEVVTEGNWATRNVNISDLSFIEETQFGRPSDVNPNDPTDFAFLVPLGTPVRPLHDTEMGNAEQTDKSF